MNVVIIELEDISIYIQYYNISSAFLFSPTDNYIIHQPTKPAVQKTLRALYYYFMFVCVYVYARGFEN